MTTATKKKYNDLKKKIADTHAEMKDTAKQLFTEMTVDLFKDNPTLESFRWTQYTPYWNDGDTCTFSSHGEYPTVTILAEDGFKVRHDENYGETVWLDQEDEEIEHSTGAEKYDDQIEKISGKVSDFLGGFSDDDLLNMFGDHQEITVYKNGKIDTDQYDHE